MWSILFSIHGYTAKQLKVNGGMELGADLGPLISPEAKERVCHLVQNGIDEGAKVSQTSHIIIITRK